MKKSILIVVFTLAFGGFPATAQDTGDLEQRKNLWRTIIEKAQKIVDCVNSRDRLLVADIKDTSNPAEKAQKQARLSKTSGGSGNTTDIFMENRQKTCNLPTGSYDGSRMTLAEMRTLDARMDTAVAACGQSGACDPTPVPQ